MESLKCCCFQRRRLLELRFSLMEESEKRHKVSRQLTGESVIGDFRQCGISVGYWIREHVVHVVLSDILHLAH